MNNETLTTVRNIRGYYSLMQYCPDLDRLELANFGVVLYCAELDYLGVKIAKDHRRIDQMFGRGHRDLARLKASKNGLAEKLRDGRSGSMSLEELNHLAAMQVNHLRMTKFMPCKVSSQPDQELASMYQQLVLDAAKPFREKKIDRLKREMDLRFSEPDLRERIRRDVTVTIPLFHRREQIPFAYQNGRLNLIAPAIFPKKTSAFEDRAAKFAIEGKSVYDNPDSEHGDLQMLVVGQFESNDPGMIETARGILKSHQVRLFTRDELPDLAQEIKTEGIDLAC